MAFWNRKGRSSEGLDEDLVCSACGSESMDLVDLPLEYRDCRGWICRQCGYLKLRDSRGEDVFPGVMSIDVIGGRRSRLGDWGG